MAVGLEVWFVQALRVDTRGAVWLWCHGVTDPFEVLPGRVRVVIESAEVAEPWPDVVGAVAAFLARHAEVTVTLAIDAAGRVIRAAFAAGGD